MTPESVYLKRFWSKVDVKGPLDCWEWKSGKSTAGYGYFYFHGNNRPAHRWIFEANNGQLPRHLFVCHICDNPPCVNPAHLFAGENKDNMHDALYKGRFAFQQFQKPVAKIRSQSWETIKEIRSRYKRGNGRALAKEFGMTHQNLYLIVSGKTWKPSADPAVT